MKHERQPSPAEMQPSFPAAMITVEQAQQFNAELDKGLPYEEVVQRLGGVELNGADIVLVTTTSEDNQNTAKGYMVIGENDPGTMLRPDEAGTFGAHNLPPVDFAYDVMKQRDAEQQGTNSERQELVTSFTERQQRIFGAKPDAYEDDKQQRRWEVTEESSRDSFSTLVRAVGSDERLSSLVEDLRPEGATIMDMVDLIRTDKKVRFAVADYLSRKLDAVPLLRLPERVAVNSMGNLKNPNYPGYGKMSSREYATLLALAMIDGTFKNASAQHDKITTKDGYVTTGQHRAAAQLALFEDPEMFGRQTPYQTRLIKNSL